MFIVPKFGEDQFSPCFVSVSGIFVSTELTKALDINFCRIHGTGIFTYMYHKNQHSVGKYTGLEFRSYRFIDLSSSQFGQKSLQHSNGVQRVVVEATPKGGSGD